MSKQWESVTLDRSSGKRRNQKELDVWRLAACSHRAEDKPDYRVVVRDSKCPWRIN